MTTSMRDLITQSPEQLTALAAELERVAKTKKDYIVPASRVRMENAEGAGPFLAVDGLTFPNSATAFNLRRIAHEQVADKLGIPMSYYRRMQAEAPELLATNVNRWLGTNGKNHLLRTIDGDVRAFLSDSYRVLDNFDLFYQAIPVITGAGGVILKADLTEERMYIRAIHPEYRAIIEAQKEDLRSNGSVWHGDSNHRVSPDFGNPGANGGTSNPDLVCPGVLVRNSEVGRGGLMVAPYIFRFTCSNGAYLDSELFQVHHGRRNGEGEYLSDETRQLEDAAFWGKVKDLMTATFDRERFAKLVASMNDAASTELAAPVEAVDSVVKAYGLTDQDRQGILDQLISGGNATVWGLLNAVTWQAHAAETAGDVDRGFEYQRIGGDLLNPSKVRELVAVR